MIRRTFLAACASLFIPFKKNIGTGTMQIELIRKGKTIYKKTFETRIIGNGFCEQVNYSIK